MEGKLSNCCCPTGVSCGDACCKCGPGWTCVITKIEAPAAGADDLKPFYNCSISDCVCITEEKQQGEEVGGKQVVETEGACCECGPGYACTITKTEGPDAGKVVFDCGNACKCYA